MEKPPSYSPHNRVEPESGHREWALEAQISRENTRSRRFSTSHVIRSFREDARSFRSNITISSTASSPGYPIKEEIDPSTYSFTTALKALQARAGYNNNWECYSSPEGFVLNSKWNDAEKYICNPLSGEVPLECLSSKTLSFRHLTNRITMSAPLIYSNPIPRHVYPKPSLVAIRANDTTKIPVKEKKMEGMTRDVGTQSTPVNDHSSSSPSPTTSTPSIVERSLKRCEEDYQDSPNGSNTELEAELKDEEKETRNEENEATKNDSHKEEKDTKDKKPMWKSNDSSSGQKQSSNGCLSWMRKRQREKHIKNTCLLSLKGC